MNQKIPFHDLSARIALATGISGESAELFVKEFFELLSESLIKGENVKIKGLGLFNIVEANGEKNIEFIPDKDISDAINAPFAMFEAVQLNDDLSDEMLSEVDSKEKAEETSTEPESVAETPGETEQTHATTDRDASTASTVQSETSESMEESTDRKVDDNVVDNIPVVEEIIVDTPQEETYQINIPVTPAESELPVNAAPEADTLGVPANDEQTDTTSAPQSGEAPVNLPPASNLGEPQVLTPPDIKPLKPSEPTPPASPAKEMPKPQSSIHIAAPLAEEDEEFVERKSSGAGSGNFWTGLTVGLIVGLALGACATYLAIDNIFPTMHQSSVFYSEEEEIEAETLNSIPEADIPDKTEMEGKPAAEADTATPVSEPAAALPTEQQPVEQAAAAPSAQPTTDTIRKGYLLNNMAKKHYGSKDFWVYIYEENKSKIGNPNNVQPGMELIIPAPEKYGIDSNSQESLRKARNKAAEVLRKYPR